MLFSYTRLVYVSKQSVFFLIYFFIVINTIVLAACNGNLGTTWPKSAKWDKFWGERWRCWGGHYIQQCNYIILYALWTDASVTSQRNSCVRPFSKFLQASLLQTEWWQTDFQWFSASNFSIYLNFIVLNSNAL